MVFALTHGPADRLQGRKGTILEYRPRRLSPDYFAKWMMGIDSPASATLHKALRPFLDAEGVGAAAGAGATGLG